MTRYIFSGVAAVLMATIATPVFAQAAIQEPGLYAFYHPGADLYRGRSAPQPPNSANAYLGDRELARVNQPHRRPVAPRHHRR